jgi:Flp pilus assembly protein TadG
MKRAMAPQPTFAKRPTSAIWRSLRRFMRGRGDGIRGVAAIEFAVIASCLILMMIGTTDLGMGFYRKMQVQNAAQAGAQYAMLHGFDADSISVAITSATTFSDITSSPAPTQFYGCPSSTGVATANYNQTCPDGSISGKYVTAQAHGTYDTILRYPPLLIPNSFSFTAASTVRVP